MERKENGDRPPTIFGFKVAVHTMYFLQFSFERILHYFCSSRPISCAIKAKFHYAIWFEAWSQTGSKLVADLQRAEIWPII